MTAPGGAVTTNTYTTSSLGQVATVSTPAMVSGNAGSISRQSTTDAQGRLVQVIEDPAGNNYLTAYTYDALDNLTGVTQAGQSNSACPNGQSRCFQYDSLKRLRQANNPESGQLTYTYDASGNLSTKLDARSITATLSYDGMNRVQSKSYSSLGNGVSYVYDGTQSGCSGLGRLASVTSGTSTSNYSCYDAMGHVTTSSQTTAGTTYPAFQYKWNISGTLDTETYPSGRTVTNSYDAAGRVNLVQGQATTGASKMSYASNILYAAQGAMQSLALGNGVSETWSFATPELQPTQLVANGTNASLTLTWAYCPDSTCSDDTHNNGNVLGATIVGNKVNASQQFTYDAINRLATANETNGWSQNYNYDAFGNLTGGAATGIPTAFPASISATNNRITDPGWRYDLAGNVIQSPAAASVVYDAENRQTSYTTSGSAPATATYVYDGEGRRVRKTEADGTTTTYVYDAKGQLAVEYDTGAPAATGTQYLTADNLGSTRMLTDTSGNPVACHDYQPFGAEIPPGINGRGTCYAGTDNPKQKFTGKERDAETGLDFFGARYLSSAQGRWTTPDWSVIATPVPYAKLSNPQSLNLYTYVLNNPLGFADPDGHFAPLSDDEETRKRQLAGYKHAVGKQAGAYLYDNVVEGKHYVGIYTNGQDGKGPSFESINGASKQIGAIIGDQGRELRINFVPQGTEIGKFTIGPVDAGQSPAVTSWSNGGRTATVNVTSGGYGELSGDQTSDRKSTWISFADILSHEAGHAYSRWYLGDSAGKGNSVRMENVTRQIEGGPTRTNHDEQGDVGKTTF